MRFFNLGRYALALVVLYFAVGIASAAEPVKLNAEGFKQGCICTGQTYSGETRYDKVLVVAITPEGSDYWVFYPDDLETRHRRSDGTLMALRLPTEQFLEKNSFRPGKTGRLKCPDTFWGQGTQVASADQ